MLLTVTDGQALGERYSEVERLNITVSGKRFRCNFIKPGLVSYTDRGADGYEKLSKKTLDEYLNTMIGRPLIIRHVPTNKPVPADRIKGTVDKVGFDGEWYYCEGDVQDDEAREAINSMQTASCGYCVPREKSSYGPGGTEHNIPFVSEIRRLSFHHLAIVDDQPRYEDARILLNSKSKPKPAMFKALFKSLRKSADAGGADTTVEETASLPAETMLELDGGEKVSLKDLHTEYANAIAAKATAAAEAAKKPAAPVLPTTIDRSTVIELEGGEKVTVGQMLDERANSIKAKAVQKKKDEDAASTAGAQSFRVLAEARTNSVEEGPAFSPDSGSMEEQMARGKSMFGSAAKPTGNN